MNFKNWLILSEEQLLNERWRDIAAGNLLGNEVFKIRFDNEHTFIAYDPKTNRNLGFLIVNYKNEDGSRSVQVVSVHPEFMRQGIATSLYKAAEQEFGELTPTKIALSDNAFDFWKTYRPEAVKNKTDLRPFKDQLLGKKFDHPRLGPIEIIKVDRTDAQGLIKNKEQHTEISLNKNDLVKFNLLPINTP